MRNIKKRIEKLERRIPQKDKHKKRICLSLHGAHPSKKEKAIAFRRKDEIESHVSPSIVFFAPYDCEDKILPSSHKIISKDANLGILYSKNWMIKLVDQYDSNSGYHGKSCPVITGEKGLR